MFPIVDRYLAPVSYQVITAAPASASAVVPLCIYVYTETLCHTIGMVVLNLVLSFYQ